MVDFEVGVTHVDHVEQVLSDLSVLDEGEPLKVPDALEFLG